MFQRADTLTVDKTPLKKENEHWYVKLALSINILNQHSLKLLASPRGNSVGISYFKMTLFSSSKNNIVTAAFGCL